MATAVTYRTGERKSALRTVLVEDAQTVTVVTGGGIELLTGKLLHGTTCACRFWADELGLSGDGFAVEKSAVVQVREMQIGAKVVRHK